MSYINSDLLIPWSNYKTQASHNIQKGIKDFEERDDEVNPNQEHIATHYFSNLVTHVRFLQLQCYRNLYQACHFDSNFAT